VTAHERSAQETVEGERGVSTLKLARSTRSRVSNLLALGLVLAVGASLLGWYYTGIVGRQVRAPQGAPARSSGAAPAEVPHLDDRGVNEALGILTGHDLVRPVARMRPFAVLS